MVIAVLHQSNLGNWFSTLHHPSHNNDNFSSSIWEVLTTILRYGNCTFHILFWLGSWVNILLVKTRLVNFISTFYQFGFGIHKVMEPLFSWLFSDLRINKHLRFYRRRSAAFVLPIFLWRSASNSIVFTKRKTKREGKVCPQPHVRFE